MSLHMLYDMMRRHVTTAGRGSFERVWPGGVIPLRLDYLFWAIDSGDRSFPGSLSPIYKSDLWPFICRDAGVLSVIFISGDPFISGFPGPCYLSVGIRLFQDSPGRFRWLWVSAQRLVMVMMMTYLSSVYFGTLELDLWLLAPSDGYDRCRPVRIARLLRYLAGGNKSKLMDPPNTDILELKEMVRDLFRVVQGLALGQKAMAERLKRIEGWMIKEKVQGKALSSEVTNPSGSVVKKSLDSGQPKKKRQSPPQQRTQRAGGPVRRRAADRHFNKPPVTYASLFKRLKDLGLVQPRMLTLLKPDQRPAGYDENVRCEFHAGAPRHHVEDCKAFKNVVQDLVDSKAINFAPSPNVNANPMPAHGQTMVSAIAEDSDHACGMGEETDGNCEFDGWIKPCVPGSWKA
ncbi:hypothetical protein KIW84_051282 [Lathyrus oleraceus]|uniref:Uncharacterized protein n=1 Tax=Pisum sativum TaxID=3888 RepID=A0A9D5ADE4_PEA|nr:hypothetical protein KIW84_051282 [Pisum sativum]